jgi:glycerophosphoryl diester phosphodiesterase
MFSLNVRRLVTARLPRARPLLGLAVCLACMYLIVHPSTAREKKAMPTQANRTFDLSAHRGGRGLCPENTLPAFANALAIGVTSLEMDAAVTKDGVVVISHDPVLNPDITRGPNGQWIGQERRLIKELSFSELAKYDVGGIRPGTKYREIFGDQKSIEGTRIPSLAAVIDLVRSTGQKDVVLSVEAKFDPTDDSNPTVPADQLARAMIDVLRKERFARRAYIQSFDWAILEFVQQVAPEIATVYLTSGQPGDDTLGIGKPGGSKWTGKFDVNKYNGSTVHAIKAAGGRLWSPDSRDLDAQQIKTAHELGIKVLPWTVNDVDQMASLIEWGVDGMITDYPDRLRRALEEKGIRVTKPGVRNKSSTKCRTGG